MDGTDWLKGQKKGSMEMGQIGYSANGFGDMIGRHRGATVSRGRALRRQRQDGVSDFPAGIPAGASCHTGLHYRLRPHHRGCGEWGRRVGSRGRSVVEEAVVRGESVEPSPLTYLCLGYWAGLLYS